MKFKKEKVFPLTGTIEFHFTEESTWGKDDAFVIKADAQGIRFEGKSPVMESTEDLQVFAKAVTDAYKSHSILKPKLTLNERGH